jgi:putative hydrolase of the HAD superfamily
MPTIRVLVCDLDGVVRHFDPDIQAGVERSHGLDPGTIARIALHPTHLIPAVSGLVSDEEWRSRIADELAALIDDRDARDAMAAWSADVGSVDASVLDLLRRARRHCPVIIFSKRHQPAAPGHVAVGPGPRDRRCRELIRDGLPKARPWGVCRS